MRRVRSAVFAAVVGFSTLSAAAPKRHTPASAAVPAVSPAHKKALAEKFGGFKFGMTKDDVLAVLQKQINEQYEDKIKATTDIADQDQLRNQKREDIARIAHTFIEFGSKPSPWDVSIVEGEFAHNTGESMLDHWENEGGKNQRRFFFFYNNRLWKMYISLDVSMIPEDKRNFDTFKSVMEAQFGPGAVTDGTITWRAGEFDVRAVDKLRDYGALGLAIEDPKVRTEVLAVRDQHKPPEHQTSAVIRSVIDTNNSDHPTLQDNSGAVDAVIHAQGK